MKSKSGFTIVELLIVIVVIGILAAITVVAFNGMKARAQAASVQSDLDYNMKQLFMYKAEKDTWPYSTTNACGIFTSSNRLENPFPLSFSNSNGYIAKIVSAIAPQGYGGWPGFENPGLDIAVAVVTNNGKAFAATSKQSAAKDITAAYTAAANNLPAAVQSTYTVTTGAGCYL